MKIAILGTRGIPANYGGFERFAEECATGLVERGHEVTVYGRSHYIPRSLHRYRNVRLVVLPTLRWKYTDTVVHTFLSVLHAVPERYDAMVICNAANAIHAIVPRLFGVPVALNVDGIERRRKKWGWLGRGYYWISERLSTWIPSAIITDALVIERYYRERYGARSMFIPYGATTHKISSRETLERLGLTPGEYFLYVSRLEPENNAHRVVAAFEQVCTEKRLVLVGDAPYSRLYIEGLKRTRDPRILFPGAIHGSGYWELQANAFCFIHAKEVGGTHPALVEAMGQGNIVVANVTPENLEIMGDTGLMYRMDDCDDLARRLQDVADHPEKYASLKEAAVERIQQTYSWDRVVTQYEDLLASLVAGRSP